MRFRGFLILGLAIALGVVAVLYYQNSERRAREEAAALLEQRAPLAEVVVARTALLYGDRVGPEHLRVVQWPSESVPPGAFSAVEQIVGGKEERYVLRPIEPGEPILPGKISGFGQQATIAAVLDPSMRAVTIRVNDVAGVAGFVMPGDKVDVLLTHDASGEGRGANPMTSILLQNVRVLGIDQTASGNEAKPKVVKAVTLEVTPVQAQKLALAQTVGQLSLALRHVGSSTMASSGLITMGDLTVGEIIREQAKPADATSPETLAPVVKKVVASSDTSRKVTVIRGVTLSVERMLSEAGPLSLVTDQARTQAAGADAQATEGSPGAAQ
jgi:pilus assembly protein CpaB